MPDNFFHRILRDIMNRLNPSKPKDTSGQEWFVEYQGEVIGELTCPKSDGLIGHLYQLTCLNKDYEEALLDIEMWHKVEFRFRNKKYNKYAEGAFTSLDEDLLSGNINMWGLYLKKWYHLNLDKWFG